jgi:Raf kinase inhibitor-like YbhB/YbcL family protein
MRSTLGLVAALVIAGCGGGGDTVKGPPPSAPEKIRLTSPVLHAGSPIPKRFTCDGDETSPPLRWSGTPARAKELALLLEDPDAPGGTFVHWVVLRLRPALRVIPEGRVPPSAIEAKQSFGDKGYGGLCPPKGDEPHHYVFTLYALDRQLGLDAGAGPDKVRSAIRGAAFAEGTLRATYAR